MVPVQVNQARAPRLPNGAILAYKAILFEALDEAQAQIEKLIAPRLEKLAKRTDARATDLDVRSRQIDTVFTRVDEFTTRETGRVLGKFVASLEPLKSPLPKRMRDAFRKENVALIKSISEDQLDQVTELLDEAFDEGRSVESLKKDIKERFDVSKSRADLIARDQVLKLNAQITKTRHRAVGITHYTWSTSQDERVRPMHDDLEGEEFAWDDPPVTNEDGDRNHPGEDYQCRCVAIPVVRDLEADDDDE